MQSYHQRRRTASVNGDPVGAAPPVEVPDVAVPITAKPVTTCIQTPVQRRRALPVVVSVLLLGILLLIKNTSGRRARDSLPVSLIQQTVTATAHESVVTDQAVTGQSDVEAQARQLRKDRPDARRARIPAPSPLIQSQILALAAATGVQLVQDCSVPGTMAATFASGPYIYEQALLNVFASAAPVAGAAPKLTLAVNGDNWACVYNYETTLKAAVAAGHQIINMGWSYVPLAGLTTAKVQWELNRLDYALQRLIGKAPTYMRPPYGSYDQTTLDVVGSLGYKAAVTWDLDSEDWNNPTNTAPAQSYYNAWTGTVGPLSTQEEVYSTTVNTLAPWIINWARSRNYRMVTVAECIGDTDPAGWYRTVSVPASVPSDCSTLAVPSSTPSAKAGVTPSNSPTPLPSVAVTPSNSPTPSVTKPAGVTGTPTPSTTKSAGASPTPTPSTTKTSGVTPTPTPSTTKTAGAITPSPTRTPGATGLQVITQCTVPGTMAAQFAQGPYIYTQTLLNLFANAALVAGAKPKMTLAVNGDNWDCIYGYGAALTSAINAGHQIINMGWSYTGLPGTTVANVQWELNRVDYALQRLIGKAPTYMRPPFGSYDQTTLNIVGSMGYKAAVTWNLDAQDWATPTDMTTAKAAYTAWTGTVGPLSTQEEVYSATVNDLAPWIINWARTNNYRMVTVAECIGDTDPAGWYRTVSVPASVPSDCSTLAVPSSTPTKAAAVTPTRTPSTTPTKGASPTGTPTKTPPATPTPTPSPTKPAPGPIRIVSDCTVPGTVAVTYDDGPYIYEQALVDAYRNAAPVAGAKPKMTLFVNGNNWDCVYKYGSSLNAALADGHQIGHHSWAHNDLTTYSAAQITADMNRLDYALQRLIGKAPVYMRPPYGSYNTAVTNTLTKLGYKTLAMWNIDTEDYNYAPSTTFSKQQYTDFDTTTGKALALEHEPYQSTVTDLTPWIFDWARQRNVRMVTVAECLGDTNPTNWYRQVTVPANYPTGCA